MLVHREVLKGSDMTPEYAQSLARYNQWMNDKVYSTGALLSDEDRKQDRGAFFKSMHATLNHLLVADRIWMGRLLGERLEDDWLGPGGIRSLDQELHADFVELSRERRSMDEKINAWAATLRPDTLLGTLRYVRKGAVLESKYWWAVAQLFNHQTHHRGQVTTLLSQAGHDVGVTDLFTMLREEAAKSA
jgi:uncharacterized damage-inducible protein DinB